MRSLSCTICRVIELKHTFSLKNTQYTDAEVHEYWIAAPAKGRITIYHYVEDDLLK